MTVVFKTSRKRNDPKESQTILVRDRTKTKITLY
ncbi:hypothetical protein M7I_0930 [Glarea lozoyensis 74030]|uniref:Uncharacterized protein n=1 Tax=Glarea lozoyensis (strain ATCC 74030 / MF5533) TaxID=1104152 RepID=H0EEQ0_GLAL7|nr:hypothetical protein M7I_0930 [Glarea lozoyensis 74030]